MLYRTDFDENGRKTLCQMDGVNADMLMDIFVQKLAPGDTLTLEEAEKECAVLLLSGQVTFAVGSMELFTRYRVIHTVNKALPPI